MNHHVSSFPRVIRGIRFVALISTIGFPGALLAQTSIELFSGPVDVRLSAAGTGYGANAVNFNSNTLNLTCAALPISAVLSSTPDSSGNLLVDNNINVTVTSGATVTGPTNVCTGGANGSPNGPFQNCFGAGYVGNAGTGNLVGDPDNFAAADGIPPIDISQLLVPGPIQVQIALQDEGSGPGFYLASSTIYLDTNCTQTGVTGPALVTGNSIPSSGATADQLSQDFSFNPLTGQSIGFGYDLTVALAAGDLSIQDGTIPQVADSPLDPAIYQSQYAPNTSFSTSICLIHSGELLANGQPACKLYTLECKVGTGSNASGAQCPVSAESNEIFQDEFNGPAFTLADIPTPNGPTFHEGIGMIMANEGWSGGACSFDTAADLGSLDCPQNLLTSFASNSASSPSVRRLQKLDSAAARTKPSAEFSLSSRVHTEATSSTSATNTSSGRTTRPNSTFITIAKVPEDLTTVTVAGQHPGYWINSPTAKVTFSSQPPNLAGTTLPGAATFVPSPIQSITFGISPAASVPVAGSPVTGDLTLANSVGCPTPPNLTTPTATVFTPDPQTLYNLADGYHLVHYFAEDCAGTQELLFTQDSGGNWSTGFYTYPINVDTVPPAVSSGPTLSPAASAQGTYRLGQPVTASFSCTDALSGITHCGGHSYAPGATNNTGTLTSAVDTSTPGSKTFTVQAVDAAGNQSSESVQYQVVSTYDSQIKFTLSSQTVTYPQGANAVVKIVPLATANVLRRAIRTEQSEPTGTVKILDGSKLVETLRLQGDGTAYGYIAGLGAGKHTITAAYSGDSNNPSGTSAPVTFTVKPVPVNLGVACWNATFPYGASYFCGAYASSDAGPAQGVITYKYDNATPVTVPLNWGVALFTISKPPVGRHTVVVSYAAQTNYAAANPQTKNFTVTPASVNIGVTPSTWYLTGGNLTLTAAVQSWSAGPPKSTGSVTFTDGSKTLGVIPMNSSGNASLTVAASALANGVNTFTAAYAGGTNYGTGSTSVAISVAHP